MFEISALNVCGLLESLGQKKFTAVKAVDAIVNATDEFQKPPIPRGKTF